MAGKVGELFVAIGGDISGLSSALGRASARLASFGSQVAATALGTALPRMISSTVNGMTSTFSGAITNASNLNETLSKTDVLLGGQAQRAKDFAMQLQIAGKSGMNDTLESVSSIVTAMTNLGTSTGVATDKAMQLQERFIDVASQSNKSVKEVQDAYQSLLAGQIEPLRGLQVYTTMDKLNKAGKPLGEAAFDEFMKQTSRAAGDFDRTKYSYSNLAKSGDIASQGTSTAIGQNLLLVGQAFQYFRVNFLGQITAIVSGGVLKQMGESLYNGVASIGFALQAVIPLITETLASWATRLASVMETIAVVIASAIENPTAMWGVITDSIGLALLSVKEKLWAVASTFTGGMASNASLPGQRQALEDSLAANMGAMSDTQSGMQGRVADLKAKLLAGSGAGSVPLTPGGPQSIGTATQSRSMAFTSLLDGVIGSAQEKQTAILEQINTGINTLVSYGIKTGAAPVVDKPTLASITGLANNGWAAWGHA